MDKKKYFDQAKKLHQQGRLLEAKAIYESVLNEDPLNAQVMHLLGLVAAQTNQFELAIAWFNRAIAIDPLDAKFHNNLATALADANQHLKAITEYEKAIAIDSSFVDAYYNKAVAHIAVRQWQDAVKALQQVLKFQSEFFEAWYLLGNALQELKRLDEAISCYRRAISINNKYAPLFFNLGNALHARGDLEQAIENYEHSLTLDVGFIDAYINLGVALKEANQIEKAISIFEKAIELDANSQRTYFNLGNAYKQCKKYELALQSYDSAIRIDDKYQEAYLNKGAVLTELQLLQQALECYAKAIELNFENALAHFNYANTLAKQFKFEEALKYYDKAIFFKKDYAEAYFNRGNIFLESGNPIKAIENYDQAIASDPEYVDALWNKSNAMLLAGEYENGWKLYEIRRRENQTVPPRTFKQPTWLGVEPIAGKTIFVHSEQGLGDTLQFVRYAPKLTELGARVILEVQSPLYHLLNALKDISLVIKAGDKVPDFDMHCPMMSLPLAFKTTVTTIPAPVTLRIKEDKKIYWSKKLGQSSKPRVGLVWSGGFRPDKQEIWEINGRRNLPLHHLKALSGIEVDFISLQKGEPAESEFRQAVASGWDGPFIQDHVGELKDFSDTAALVMNLDLVIAVDTSTAHLAATLGKPVWLLNRFDTCWRWLLDREDSPWYPSIKIYRQPAYGDWESVMQRVKTDLVTWKAMFHAKG